MTRHSGGRSRKRRRGRRQINDKQIINIKKHRISFLGRQYQAWEIVDKRYEPTNRMYYRFIIEMPYELFQKYLRVVARRRRDYANILNFSYLVTFGATLGAKI